MTVTTIKCWDYKHTITNRAFLAQANFNSYSNSNSTTIRIGRLKPKKTQSNFCYYFI